MNQFTKKKKSEPEKEHKEECDDKSKSENVHPLNSRKRAREEKPVLHRSDTQEVQEYSDQEENTDDKIDSNLRPRAGTKLVRTESNSVNYNEEYFDRIIPLTREEILALFMSRGKSIDE